MTGVVGAIDCTHVKIDSVGGPNAELFRNRKDYFSINVQAVCDADLNFLNVAARWYGSAHDSRILEDSSLYLTMSQAPELDSCLGTVDTHFSHG
jgi:nuclease HARBI1